MFADGSPCMNINKPDFIFPASLPLPKDEVQLWRIELDATRANESRWRGILSSEEDIRAARFRSPLDQHRYAATRGALRMIIAAYLAVNPRSINFSYSPREKPSIGLPYEDSGITFNVSHSGAVSLLAFARQRKIGVDVEELRQNFELAAIARRFFSAHEQQQLFALSTDARIAAFFRCWTRKEAYIKATGDGLSLPLCDFDVSISENDPDALLATRPEASGASRWLLRDVPAGPGHIGALCVEGRDWHLKDWTVG